MSIHFTDDTRVFDIIKQVAIGHQRDFSLYPVRFGKLPDLKNFFFSYHNRVCQSRVIRAPMLFKRLSIF